MPAFQLALALASLAVSSFAPGFFCLRRARLSLVLLYLIAWAFYCIAPGC